MTKEVPKRSDIDEYITKPLIDIKFDENYHFINKKWYFKIARIVMGFITFTLGRLISKILNGTKIKGKRNFKKHRKELKNGVMSVCNHIHPHDYIAILALAFPKLPNHPAWINGMKGKERMLIRLNGGIPLGESLKAMYKMQEAFNDRLQNKGWVHFYPEGSMWSFHEAIRPFKKGAFQIAIKNEVPILPFTYTFREPGFIYKLFGKRKKLLTLHIGTPLYPNKELPFREQVEELKDRTHKVMSTMMGLSEEERQFELNRYPENNF